MRRVVLVTVAVMVLVAGLPGPPGIPGAGPSPAAAVPQPGDPPPHWGRSPWFPDCLEGPCRAVLVIDKTFDPLWSFHLRRWVDWMTWVRTNFNRDLPAFAYVGAAEGVLPDPSCAGFAAAITVCANDGVVAADCPTVPDSTACATATREEGTNHRFAARLSHRVRPYGSAAVWNLVCRQMGWTMGLSTAQPDPSSCMHGATPPDVGGERYLAVDDWITLWSIYSHPPAA